MCHDVRYLPIEYYIYRYVYWYVHSYGGRCIPRVIEGVRHYPEGIAR
jgi:hypothetical protein